MKRNSVYKFCLRHWRFGCKKVWTTECIMADYGEAVIYQCISYQLAFFCYRVVLLHKIGPGIPLRYFVREVTIDPGVSDACVSSSSDSIPQNHESKAGSPSWEE